MDQNESENIVQPVYIDINDLDDIEDKDLDRRITYLIKSLNYPNPDEWIPQFESIMDLRRLLKYKRYIFIKVFNDVYKEYGKQIISLRSGCSKLSLILLSELFSTNSGDIHDEWFETLIPIVLIRANYLQKFIKEEALNVFNNLSSNVFYFKALEVLIMQIGQKNVSDVAFDTSIKLISNWDLADLLKIHHLPVILHRIVELQNLKREPFNKRSIKVLACLIEKLGHGNLRDLVLVCDSETKIKLDPLIKQADKQITISNSNNNSGKMNSGSIKDFIKEVKPKANTNKTNLNGSGKK